MKWSPQFENVSQISRKFHCSIDFDVIYLKFFVNKMHLEISSQSIIHA